MSYSERINTVKGDIDALVTYANETTGESDKTISEAVGHLVDGFGGGSGYTSRFFTLDKIKITFDAETASSIANTSDFANAIVALTGYPIERIWGIESLKPLDEMSHNNIICAYGTCAYSYATKYQEYRHSYVQRYRNEAITYATWDNTNFDASVQSGDEFDVYIMTQQAT